MERKFGVELEIAGVSREQALRALQSVGISAQDMRYNHNTEAHWKLVSDSSVRNGFEVVSPVLQGLAGLDELRTVMDALSDAGGRVNRTCGMHVHFDAANLSVADIRNIVTRYAAHEAQIDSFLPPSRRGNGNSYCHSVIDLAGRRQFQTASTIQELTAAQGSRYFKVNLQSYHRHGTLEFRQHSGTLNARKAVSWVLFLGHFIEASRQPAAPAAPSCAPCAPRRLNSAPNQALLDMLRQNGWVSLADIQARFGWLAHSGRAAITRLRDAGCIITHERQNGLSGYRLLSEGNQAPAAPADDLFAGIPARVVTFYQSRALALAA